MIQTCQCIDFPCCGHGEDIVTSEENFREMEEFNEYNTFGDDDLENMNANEADDYRNEGDAGHDEAISDWEADTPLGQEYGDGFDNAGDGFDNDY